MLTGDATFQFRCNKYGFLVFKTWYKEGPEFPLLNQIPSLVKVPPVIQDSKVPPFSPSILHMIPRNNPNSKMDERHI